MSNLIAKIAKDMILDSARHAAEGAADEITFGGYNKYVPGAKEAADKHKISNNAGRIGSYIIPLPIPSKLKALTKMKNMPDGLRQLNALIGRVKGLKGTALRTLTGATEAAGKGVAIGETQHALREGVKKLPGGKNPEENQVSAEDRVAAEAGLSMLFRGAGQGAKKLAPWIYSHPGLINKDKLNESTMNAKDLLRQRLFGTLQGKFRGHANKLEDEVNVVKDKIIPRAAKKEQRIARGIQAKLSALSGKPEPKPRGMTTLDTLNSHGKASTKQMHGSEPAEREAMKRSFKFTGKQMGTDKYGLTNINEVDRVAREVNTQIKNSFSGAEKGKAYGQLDGSLSAKKERLTKLKEGVDQMEYDAIDQLGRRGDLDKYENARRTYRTGVDLNDAIDSHLRATHGKDPYATSGWARNAFNASVGAAPVRTGLGVLLDSVARGRNAGGQIAEMRSRNSGQPKPANEMTVGGDMLMELPEADAEEAPAANEEARAASAKKFGLSNPAILAAISDPTDPAKNKAGVEAHKKVAPKQYKAAPKEDDEENLLIKLPPPR